MTTEDPYRQALLDQSTSLIYGVRQNLDDYLLSFFGAQENAERYGHLYIFEQSPYEFETELDSKSNVMKVTAHMTYRLRLKTEQELREESRSKNMDYNESKN